MNLEKLCQEKAEVIISNFLDEEINTNDNGLYSGRGGISLLYLTYFKDDINKYSEVIQNPIILAFNSINQINTPFKYSFCEGIAGINWLILLLAKNNIIDSSELEILDALDSFLIAKMETDLNNNNYDFLHGALGIATYYILKYSFTNNKAPLEQLVNGLKENAIWNNSYCYWLFKVGSKGDLEPSVSLAHGIPSVVIILSKIYALGIMKDECRKMIIGAIEYIATQKVNTLSLYATINTKYDKKDHSRLAWCYGDIGVALAYWQAGKNLNNKIWKDTSIEIAQHIALRKNLKENYVVDACFCHGSSGIAQFFNRMYIETKHTEFEQAMDYWIDVTLKMGTSTVKNAGYTTWTVKDQNDWTEEYSLLEGIVGIGLVLLSYKKEKIPFDWDMVFLMS